MFSKIETKQIVGRESQRAHWPKAPKCFFTEGPWPYAGPTLWRLLGEMGLMAPEHQIVKNALTLDVFVRYQSLPNIIKSHATIVKE